MNNFPITKLTSLQIANPINSDNDQGLSPTTISQTGAGGFSVAVMTIDQRNALTPRLVAGVTASPFGVGTIVYVAAADNIAGLYVCTVAPTLAGAGTWVKIAVV